MRKNLRRTAAAGLTVLLAALAAGCGDKSPSNPTPVDKTWALTVRVANEQKVAVKNATVRVTDGSDAGRTAMTDESGTAVFSALNEGTFNIEVTATDYYKAASPVSLTTSRTVSVTLKERNQPPVLKSLVSVGTLPNQPSGMAEVGEEVQVIASISDAETTVDKLVFTWTADLGTFSGSGAVVRWRAPSSGSWPATASIGVTIVERFTAPDTGQPAENRTTGTLGMRVHQSTVEVAGLANTFLLDFSNSAIPAETVIRNFSTSGRCAAGRTSELSDVSDNRLNYKILTSSIGAPAVAIAYNSTSLFRARPADARTATTCGWTSLGINPAIPTEYNKVMTANGTCWLTAIYDEDHWALCWSDFEAKAGSAGARFIR